MRARRARQRHHDVRHRRRLRRHQGRVGARPGAEGRAPRGPRDLHQGVLADRPGGPNDRGLSRKHILRVDRRLAAAAADRLRRPLPGAPLRPRDAARGDDAGVRRRRPRRARRSTSASREWTAEQIRAAHDARPTSCAMPLVSNQPQYNDAVAGHRGRGRADLRGARHRPDRLVADRAGRADRQVPARPAAAGGLARHRPGRRRGHDQALARRRRARAACSSSQPIADELGLSMAQLAVAWVLQNDNVVGRDRRRVPARAGRATT